MMNEHDTAIALGMSYAIAELEAWKKRTMASALGETDDALSRLPLPQKQGVVLGALNAVNQLRSMHDVWLDQHGEQEPPDGELEPPREPRQPYPWEPAWMPPYPWWEHLPKC
jgi:hypothetical protein